MTVRTIYVAQDNLLRADSLRLATTGAYVNSGTVTWQVKTAAGVLLASGSLAYVAASNGRWQGTLDAADAALLTAGETYYLEIRIGDGAGSDGFRRCQLLAAYDDS